MKKIHFISGLPRSGSTLLSALLKQNPQFSAAMTSPVKGMCSAILPLMSGSAEFASFFDDSMRAHILKEIFHAYYANINPNAIVFDTNRRWTGELALLERLFPDSKVICCVREVGWILDSLERAIKKNPLHVSKLVNNRKIQTVYGRVEGFMDLEHGLVGQAWSSLREAWFGDHAEKLILLPYEFLASNPEKAMQGLYQALGEPYFPHYFENIEYEEEDYDMRSGTPGLHTVKAKVVYEQREPSIPPDIIEKYQQTSFWKNDGLNTRKVNILK